MTQLQSDQAYPRCRRPCLPFQRSQCTGLLPFLLVCFIILLLCSASFFRAGFFLSIFFSENCKYICLILPQIIWLRSAESRFCHRRFDICATGKVVPSVSLYVYPSLGRTQALFTSDLRMLDCGDDRRSGADVGLGSKLCVPFRLSPSISPPGWLHIFHNQHQLAQS